MGLAETTTSLFDYVWERLRGRLEGLDDDEYLWEPVPFCWSVRLSDSGAWEAERTRPAPEPAPFTTIAWRTWHIGNECLAQFSELLFGESPLEIEQQQWYPTADEALGAMEQAWSGFSAGYHSLDDEQMAEKLGPEWGQWSESNRADAILHVADEVIHHGAEVSLLRDLYAARR